MSKDIVSSFQVAAGTTLSFFNDSGIVVVPAAPTLISVDVAGTVAIGTDGGSDGASQRVAAVYYLAELTQGSSITIESNGALKVNSIHLGGSGFGVSAGLWSPNITNNGLIDVSAQVMRMASMGTR